MTDATQDVEETRRQTVFDMAVTILEERRREDLQDPEVWATGSEIAHRTEIDKATVLAELKALGNGRLYVRTADVGDDIEVIGVDHRDEDDEDDEGASAE